MTDTTRAVTRRSIGTVFSRGNRRVIVTIGPGDVVTFRLERTRQVWTEAIQSLYEATLRWNVDAERRQFERRVKELVKHGATRRAAKKQARQEGK